MNISKPLVRSIPSAEFRKTYPRLVDPVEITVLGRVMGYYIPVGIAIDDRFVAGLRPGEPPVDDRQFDPKVAAEMKRDTTPRKTQQTERDTILRKINKGG